MSDWLSPVLALVANLVALFLGFWMRLAKAKMDQDTKTVKGQVEEFQKKLDDCEANREGQRLTLAKLGQRNDKLSNDIDELALFMMNFKSRSEAVALIKTNKEGVVTEWNAGATILLGYASADMIGQNIIQIIPVGLRQRHHTAFHALVHSNRQPRREPLITTAVNKIGKTLCVSISLSRWIEDEIDHLAAEIREIPEEEYKRLKDLEAAGPQSGVRLK